MDVRNMGYFKDDTFDLVIDKGTLDCVLCSDSPFLSCMQMMSEMQRVSKINAPIVVISNAGPDKRMLHFERPNLSLAIHLMLIEKESLVISLINDISEKKGVVSQREEKYKYSTKQGSKLIYNPTEEQIDDFNRYYYIYLISKKGDWRIKSQSYNIVYESIRKEEALEELINIT